MHTDITMTARMLGLVTALAMGCVNVIGADYEETVDALTQDQPADVAQFVIRRINCNHWLGEDPFDNDRAKEIQGAIERLRCQTIDQDEVLLRRLHTGDAKALKAIDDARDVVF
jgi:hypothetical protein